MYDPIRLAEAVEKQVVSGNARKYYRFRASKYYGGIYTADAVGCNLRCLFCWSYKYVVNPSLGDFYSSDEVSKILIEGAKRYGFSKVRVSGAEPAIGKDHLLEVISGVDSKLLFILETNGTLITENFADELSDFRNLHVRVSIKGTSPEEFSRLTLADPKGFWLQLEGIKNLVSAGVSVHASAVVSFSTREGISGLLEKLGDISPSLIDSFEPELIVLYKGVRARLYLNKIFPKIALTPEGKLVTTKDLE